MNDLTQRQKMILDLVENPNGIKVTELGEMLHVSAVTIRSELRSLERENLVYRSGGCVYSNVCLPIRFRFNTHMAEKTAIAKEAATLVSDNQSMLICHGSTCSMLVNYLDSDYKLKIVTNSTLILDLARSNRNLEVTILGGKFYPLLDATLGSHVVDQVDDYYVDTFFMGADGLSADFGVSTILEENVALFKHMASHAGKKVLLADSSKLNKKGIYRILSLDELDCLIIDSGCPSDFVHQVREKGIEVRLVEAMRGGA